MEDRGQGYWTHLPALIDAMYMVDGPVLEIGAGMATVPLHHLCRIWRRPLTTIESNPAWRDRVGFMADDNHRVIDKLSNGGEWAVCLVDSAPEHTRGEYVRRLFHRVKVFVLHDTQPGYVDSFNYPFDRFEHRRDYTHLMPHTAVVWNGSL